MTITATTRSSAPLTAHERYLFSLTRSTATTPQWQRAAIRREGLAGMTRRAVLERRRQHWAEFRSFPENRGLPAWLVAARAVDAAGWWAEMPVVPQGTVAIYSSPLGREAFSLAAWGKARKRSKGCPTPHAPRIRETDNGRTGWDRVVDRFADYLCVISPDGTRAAIQTSAAEPVAVVRVWRGRALWRGQAVRVAHGQPYPGERIAAVTPCRWQAERLRRAGLDARVVRQTREMVSAGSGETLRSGGELWVIVPDGSGGFYHPTLWETAGDVLKAIRRRAIAARAVRLDATLAERGATIWVSVADSIAGGNCQPGTAAFASDFAGAIGATGEIGGATAAAILAYRDDRMTRAACRAAALRHQ
jgi:hypothetical protein